MAPACWLCRRRAQKKNNGLCQHFCQGESCPIQLLPQCHTTRFFLICPWCFSTGTQSKCVWVSPCPSPRTPEAQWLQKLSVSLSQNLNWFLQAEVMETSFPGSGTLGWWENWCGAGTPYSSEGNFEASQDIPPNFYLLLVGVGPAHSVSLPFLLVSMWLLIYILSCSTSVKLDFRQFQTVLNDSCSVA